MRRIALHLIALATMLVAGCGTLRSFEAGHEPWVRADGPRPAGASDSLLMYFGYVRKLPAAELSKEHETVRQLYAGSRSDFNRVRYAMLLSVPGAALSEEARALDALEPLLRNLNAELHSVAYAVSVHIQEQRRSRALQQKLDALKSLDKKMIERGR